MKLETQEWIEKAEGDLKVARRERQTADPVYIDDAFGET